MPPDNRTISIRTAKYEDDSWGVEVFVTGLNSEAEANAAADHMQKLFCAEGIPHD